MRHALRQSEPKVFSIAPSQPFLSVLVDSLREGRLIEGFDARDPLQLSRCHFYVPTQRAARALRMVFAEKSDGKTHFLPTIRPLGDMVDDAAHDVMADFSRPHGAALTLAPPILLLLARLIRPWRERFPEHLRQLFGFEDIVLPASSADAVWLARALADLMDAVERQEASWDDLHTICPDDVAGWWQVTLEFLQIVTKNFPNILMERQLSNPVIWQGQMIHALAQQLAENPPDGPVIAAGSTGSIPAIATLLKVIAHLPQGAVVLGGLDPYMNEASWQALEETQAEPSVFSHPQYGLKKLITHIGAKREHVVHLEHFQQKWAPVLRRKMRKNKELEQFAEAKNALGATHAIKKQRDFYLSAAMLPAATSDAWAAMAPEKDDKQAAFLGVDLIEAANVREEALAIAIALREALEAPEAHIALVTSDRNLARRVVSELKRFGLYADDSSGQPLSQSEPAALMRLLLDCVFHPGNPVSFLSLLKHPLTCLGQERAALRRRVERFEVFALRGGAGRISLTETSGFIAERLLKMTELQTQDFADIDPRLIEEVQQLGAAIGEAARPLKNLREQTDDITIAQASIATIASFENFGRDENGTLDALYASEAGQTMVAFLRALVGENSGLSFPPAEWPQLFDALMASETVRGGTFSHPRLAIWGGLEARLQPLDMVVLGGMNEGIWPQAAGYDPFMSRLMKAQMGLEPPERRMGLAAHDFQMLMGVDHVILSRASRQDEAPSVPSRWLQRLLTVCGDEVAQAMRQRGAKYLHWARSLDQTDDVVFAARPCPKPPLDVRPKHFSITEIETLRRDPYAIYAKKILKLKPLPPLIADPQAPERGQLYHAIMASFAEHILTNQHNQKYDGQQNDRFSMETWLRLARAEFDDMQLPNDIEAIWWPRFQLLVPRIIELEQVWEPRQRYPEIVAKSVEILDGSGITLSGRADRIDIVSKNLAEVIDFKTGSTPSIKEARLLGAPQLALEGALLMRGAFEACGPCEPADFVYVRLAAKGEVKIERVLTKGSPSAKQLAEDAWARLQRLMAAYLDPEHGYLSHAVPAKRRYEGDYDHLARLYEWSAGGDTSDEGGEA